jgi:hypothetical protein
VGDVVPSGASHGWVELPSSCRVVRTELVPGEETLAMGVNAG